MINLCYRLVLTLYCIAMDGDKFLLAIGLCLVFIQPSSQINHHLDKLSLEGGHWIEFIRGVGIIMGGVIMHHDHCEDIFVEGLGYWIARNLKDLEFKSQ